jgi:hypothetical protein
MVMGYVKTFETCLTALSESIDGKLRVKKNVSHEEKLMAASYSCPSGLSAPIHLIGRSSWSRG